LGYNGSGRVHARRGRANACPERVEDWGCPGLEGQRRDRGGPRAGDLSGCLLSRVACDDAQVCLIDRKGALTLNHLRPELHGRKVFGRFDNIQIFECLDHFGDVDTAYLGVVVCDESSVGSSMIDRAGEAAIVVGSNDLSVAAQVTLMQP
jgi:hypothetical protein